MKTDKVIKEELKDRGLIRVTIKTRNHGNVNFGGVSTKDFRFIHDFPVGSPIYLSAEPAKDHKFLAWFREVKGELCFVTDQPKSTIKDARQDMTVIAEFTREFK